MKILLVSASFDRDYGGPAVSVSNLGAALVGAGARVGLWAPDGSAKKSTVIPQATEDLVLLGGSLEDAVRTFGDPDVVHDNGLWLPHNHKIAVFAARRGLPRVVSIRGMLEPWAVGHKWIRKLAAWQIYQRRDLEQASMLHATAESESEAIRARGLNTPIVTIANGVALPEVSLLAPRPASQGEVRRALFLSRLHRKKGLPMLIESWARLRPDGWQLDIAGPDEAGHRAEVEALIQKNSLSSVVSFAGPLEGKAKESAYRAADLFVLPTHSENFGMVVTEALSYGVPVLTTRGAPWSELISARCGWWVAPTIDGILSGLAEATTTAPEVLLEMGRRGRDLVAERYSWGHIAPGFVAAYTTVLSA